MGMIIHPDGKLCNTDGMTSECKGCVYHDYGYESKCKIRQSELINTSTNIQLNGIY